MKGKSKMKFCKECGHELNEGDFCSECGADNSEQTEETSAVTEEATPVTEASNIADEAATENQPTADEQPVTEMQPAAEEVPAAVENSGNKKLVKLVSILAVVLVVLVVTVVVAFKLKGSNNKYEKGYIDVDGISIGSIADEMGYDWDYFRDMYGLPEDMPEDTFENAATQYVNFGKFAELNQMSVDEIKEQMGITDESITADSTIGDVYDIMTVSTYLGGDDGIEYYKEQGALSDDVTADTLWKDVRND